MAIVRELLDHFAGSARYVSTDCGLEDHGLADLELCEDIVSASVMFFDWVRRSNANALLSRAPEG
jgi:hypothetical protein